MFIWLSICKKYCGKKCRVWPLPDKTTSHMALTPPVKKLVFLKLGWFLMNGLEIAPQICMIYKKKPRNITQSLDQFIH